LIDVNVGDVINGTLVYDDASESWTVIGVDFTTGKSTTLSNQKKGGLVYTTAYEVLEAYSTQCDEYPSKHVEFKNIQVYDNDGQSRVPTWRTGVKDNTCQQNTTVISPTIVVINTPTGDVTDDDISFDDDIYSTPPPTADDDNDDGKTPFGTFAVLN